LSTQNTVPYCQKFTPTHCFFSDFAHWVKNEIYLNGDGMGRRGFMSVGDS